MPRFLRPLCFAVLAATAAFAQQGDRPNEIQAPVPADWVIPPAPILNPAEELSTFSVAPGFRVELVAAEPLVGDPVAATFGPDGRLWVVEMRSYMLDIDATAETEPTGSVAVLEDTDGDGRFDKRTVFLDHLVMPRAVSLVGGGVLVAEPPHLWFARDTNGDGVADSKIEIAADYGGTGNPEHMANGLVWMMDNAIYSANHTTRYRYAGGDTFAAEATITRGQWGITQDDAGRIYYNSNSDPLRMDAVPSAYFDRNPRLANPRGINVQLAPADLPTWPGRITPGINRGYQSLRPNGTLPAVTAACSPVIYRGALFPAEFRGDAFICEPSGNLVKRIRLVDDNGIPKGTNAYPDTEFLTSTDERFRPVSAYNGPDGALWVIDMYRGVIQHRTYVTSYLRAQVKDRHLEEGHGMGRIWRIVPDNAPTSHAPVHLDAASSAELVAQLASASGWIRDTAQRLLVERRDSAAVPLLQRASLSAANGPATRLHALWTLEGMDALDRTTVLSAFQDHDPVVVTAAIRLSEKWLAQPNNEDVFRRVTDVSNDSIVPPLRSVVLQKALSLGAAKSSLKLPTLADVAERFGRDPLIADAIASGVGGEEEAFLELVTSRPTANDATAVVASVVGPVLRSDQVEQISRVLSISTNAGKPAWARSAVLDGVDRFVPRRADGASVIGSLPAPPAPLLTLAEQPGSKDGARAVALLDHLRWPGKPGDAPAGIPFTPAEAKLFEQGRAQYTALCAACHQPQGQGLAGLAPPLVNSRWALGPDKIAARIVLCGKEDEGKIMPALKAVLDDQAIASVLTFVRNSWGHAAKAVAIETVAAVRAETAGRNEPFHEAQLVELLQHP